MDEQEKEPFYLNVDGKIGRKFKDFCTKSGLKYYKVLENLMDDFIRENGGGD